MYIQVLTRQKPLHCTKSQNERAGFRAYLEKSPISKLLTQIELL